MTQDSFNLGGSLIPRRQRKTFIGHSRASFFQSTGCKRQIHRKSGVRGPSPDTHWLTPMRPNSVLQAMVITLHLMLDGIPQRSLRGEPGACNGEINRAGGGLLSPSSRPLRSNGCGVSGRGGLGGETGSSRKEISCEAALGLFQKGVSRRAGKTNYRCPAQSINGDVRSQPGALGLTNTQWPRVWTTHYKAFARPKLA